MALTDKDLNNIKQLLIITLDEEFNLTKEDGVATKTDISHLPTKDDFFGKMDEVMGELKTIREEQSVLSKLDNKVNDNSERISQIERKLQLQTS